MSEDVIDNSANVPKAYLDLLRTLTHEVRTPLSTIIGFADMIENEMLGPLGTHHTRLTSTKPHGSFLIRLVMYRNPLTMRITKKQKMIFITLLNWRRTLFAYAERA